MATSQNRCSHPSFAERKGLRSERPTPNSWISTDLCLPIDEVLVLSEGRFAVAILLRGSDDPLDRGVFMDARSCDLLQWPSHWMLLPEAESLPPSATVPPSRLRDARHNAPG
ncbi:hypothetical protein [Sphingosinicella sp. CPCC 101087]|uniref:hypothetical protein n=1 Tax=Sphingosinicella sp. CPCC 101087 TaxID=2497754 RepID=UPI0013EC8A70|nr:hypothetical protein [Sphingosinicella sp. CPCC 101087]